MATTSSNVLLERSVKNRSYFIDAKLVNEANLDKAIACEWNGYYVIAINNRAYILDSRNKSYKDESGSDYIYECYHWDNIPAICFFNSWQ